ncbi:chromatin-binding protein RAD9 [Aspergillus saccharolyticus JOP 1030-1]|uniref:DNA damage repair protein n=1 Tax=Aspergillus saccharolyticus JOP 1030-1 TaxID=1450539 RepID=A0A319A5R8_9EURO|nr:DNA damage repair protein [Aspergillus saccharolyticus JOP 1030-1]PYH42742.1 DNA damage repair protein [Aspergillus saccharolyticus JOP 1030-1]
METQEDSIDIARLQRVALGQVFVQSQVSVADFGMVDQVKCPQKPHQHLPKDAGEGAQKSPDPVSATSASTQAQHDASDGSSKLSSYGTRPSGRAVIELGKLGSAETLPADTQVISQRVYDELLRKNREEGAVIGHDSHYGDQATLMTLHEGDSGHIDLLAGYENVHTEMINIDDDEGGSSSKLGESSPAHYQSNPFPESQRFVMKTPAAAIKCAHSDGLATISPTVSRNPLATEIGSSGGIMALSQVFRATQAPSSPLVNRQQHGDIASDRPSPNIPIQKHPLAPNLSSPFERMAATFPRDSSAHKLNYISMQESQTNRERLLTERMTRSADHMFPSDHSEDEFDKEPSFVERVRRQRSIDEEAKAQFAVVTAPARSDRGRSRQLSKGPSSPQGDLGPQVWNDGCAAENDVVERRTAADPIILQPGGLSEDETEQEQEDHRVQSIPPSAEHISMTEEDKENCLDVSATPIPPATSAHDRLSQALAFDGTSSPAHGSTEKQTLQSQHLARNMARLGEPPDLGTLSQISVIKDSQRSPKSRDADAEAPKNRSRRTSRCPDSQVQIEPTSDIERMISSPTKQARMLSSPPAGSRHTTLSSELYEAQGIDADESKPGSPQRSPTPEATQASAAIVIDSSNTISQQPGVVGDKLPAFDLQGKSSSMPSRVAETPIPPIDFADVVPTTSIPETSPSRLTNQEWPNDMNDNEIPDQEDDDLPPRCHATHERASHSRHAALNSPSPSKPFSTPMSRILSSPSGRQRRALTEIAADASPQGGTGPFNLDISIMSADDLEFKEAVGMSPGPPRKRRRGNNGQSAIASDPVLPGTPRLASRLEPPQVGQQHPIESMTPGVSTMPTDMQQNALQEHLQRKADKAYQRRSRPPRRAESVWDMDDSPPRTVLTRKDRSRFFSRSRFLSRQRTEETEPRNTLSKGQPGIVHQRLAISPVPEEPRSDITIQVPLETSTVGSPAMEDSPAVDHTMPSLVEKVPIAINQVFAPWSGTKRAYYPATCFGKPFGTSQSRYRVKFEDSAPVDIPMGAVKRLELRLGDAVKVDMPNVPKVTHVIRSFVRKLSTEEIEHGAAKGVIPMTDIYGHSAVVVGPKQRKSLPSAGLAVADNLIEVPISRIYLDTILWNQLKDRSFTYMSEPVCSEHGAPTPSERLSTPISSPSARLSRSIRFSNGLFAGMVFAVSFGDNNNAKTRVVKMILENDGRILEDGFNELFDHPLNVPAATPTKQPLTETGARRDLLQLSSGAADVGFACLIADKHSRRSKYMQALALNLPCLSDRWIEDCVARGQIVDWEIYLLPAGESTYLNGATKSRILTPYPATEARLSETIAGRPNLLNGQSVLLVTGRSGRIDEERRKAYLFLTYALGASRIERVSDLKSARAILSAQSKDEQPGKRSWDWIYIDDDDKASAKAMALSTSGSSGTGPRKRKRTKLMESVTGDNLGLSTNVRIVGNEFVCQSLILGRLFDQ